MMDEQAKRVRRRLTAFVTPEDVAASEGLSMAELDALCSIEFGMSLEQAVTRFAAEGRAQVLEAQVAAAMDGSNQMLTLLGQRYLGQGDDMAATREGGTALADVLTLLDGAKDRKSGASR